MLCAGACAEEARDISSPGDGRGSAMIYTSGEVVPAVILFELLCIAEKSKRMGDYCDGWGWEIKRS